MAKRFENHLDVWVSKEMADGLELLASNGVLRSSDHMRLALQFYLRQSGVLPAPAALPHVNGGPNA